MSTPEDAAFSHIEFDRMYGCKLGGIPVTLARVQQEEESGPVIYAAALSGNGLRHEQCGYGATEAEAAADLFRLMRPPAALRALLELADDWKANADKLYGLDDRSSKTFDDCADALREAITRELRGGGDSGA